MKVNAKVIAVCSRVQEVLFWSHLHDVVKLRYMSCQRYYNHSYSKCQRCFNVPINSEESRSSTETQALNAHTARVQVEDKANSWAWNKLMSSRKTSLCRCTPTTRSFLLIDEIQDCLCANSSLTDCQHVILSASSQQKFRIKCLTNMIKYSTSLFSLWL